MAKIKLTIDDDKVIHHLVEEALLRVAQVIHAKTALEQGIRLPRKSTSLISFCLMLKCPKWMVMRYVKNLKIMSLRKAFPYYFYPVADLEERIRGYNAGADDYIIKPLPVTSWQRVLMSCTNTNSALRS